MIVKISVLFSGDGLPNDQSAQRIITYLLSTFYTRTGSNIKAEVSLRDERI